MSYAAVFGGDDELSDLSTMDTEDVLHFSGENIPDDDREVHSSGHQRALVVAGGDLVRIQDAGHLVAVTSQGTMGGPACRTMYMSRPMFRTLNQHWVCTQLKK